MICFSFFIAYLWQEVGDKKKLAALFAVQWVLNVAWNPVFFYFHQVTVALAVIVALKCLVGYFFFHYRSALGAKSLFVLPYLIWLVLATSLNAYIALTA